MGFMPMHGIPFCVGTSERRSTVQSHALRTVGESSGTQQTPCIVARIQ